MNNLSFKRSVGAALGGVGIAWVVILAVRLLTGVDLAGDPGTGSPTFGPLAVGEVLMITLGIVGAIIGALRKRL